MVIGEMTVQLAEQLRDLTAEGAKERWRHWSSVRSACIHHDRDLPWQASELSADELLIGRNDRCGLLLPLARGKDALLKQLAQFLNFLAVDGNLAQTDLEAVVFRRIVTARDLQATVE